ncbi:MAG: T9SS type B sorting domain-containing protein [Kaistella sp.]|nr:T9SS type B sorting domain-containing protein [Kaistella sp.]
MKKTLLLAFFFSLSASLFSQKIQTGSNAFFYENKGQIVNQDGKENSAVRYLFHSNGLNVQIKKEGFSYDVYETKRTLKKGSENLEQNMAIKKRPDYDIEHQFHRVDIDFVGANKNPEIIAEGKSTDYDNYYNLPGRPTGVENVYRFEKIIYKDLYSNIDLVFFKPLDTLKPVEYNFVVNPGGRISDIRLKFKGAETHLKAGKISMALRFGEMQENIPHSWTEKNNKKEDLTVEYTDLGNNTYGFRTSHDTFDKIVVIDPVPTRIWGSYFGGNGEEFGWIKPDKNNDVYLSGYTTSTNNVATTGSYQSNLVGGADAFINKITKDGQRLWGTYYGNLYFDVVGNIDTDDQLNVYAAILSEKPNPAYPGNHYYFYPKIILLKLKSDGSLIIKNEIGKETGNPSYSGYSDESEITDVKLHNNKLYVIGHTRIRGFGTSGTFQENLTSGESGFLAKFDPVTANLDYFTYVGDNSYTQLYSIFNMDSSGIEILGTTRMTKFPMIDAFQPVNNAGSIGNNGLYLKFSEQGNLVKSSYIGGIEFYYFLTAQRFGNEIMIGGRMSNQRKFCYYLVDTSLNIVKEYKEVDVWNNDGIIYIDRHRNIFTSGRADRGEPWVSQVATPDAFLSTIGQFSSAYYTKYDLNFNRIWSTFYQGNGGSQLGMMIKDNTDNLYVWGMSSGNTSGIATPGTFQQTTDTRSNDMYIAKFADCKSNVNVSFTPTCIGQNLQLSASGGSTYEWFGPNNYHSTLQNPVINNAQAINSGEYFVRITGGQSCGGIFSINVNIGSPTGPVLDIAVLPSLTGICSVTVTTKPTATTGCGTQIIGTTVDPLTYTVPGSYIIHWTFDDGQGNILTQNQNILVTGVAKPVATTPQSFCKISSPTISNLQITGTSVKWYDAAGNSLSPTTVLTDGNKYYATQTLNGCESAKAEILATLNDPAAPTGNSQQDFCSAQNPTISNLFVTGQHVIWYDAAGSVLAASTPLSDGQNYYATQTVSGCESTQKLAVKVSVANGGIPANDYSTAFCNDTTANTKTIDLNDYRTNLISNTAGLIFEFFDSANQLITNPANQKLNIGLNAFNVKISNSLGCFVYVKLNLTLHPKPLLNLPVSAEFCAGQSVSLDAGSGFSSYEWSKDGSATIISSNQILNITTAGTYNLKVKNSFGCENSASVTVTQSYPGTISGVQIVNNNATVIMSNSGDFLYSLNNAVWQNSNTFTNLSNGNHTAYVKTQGGCIIGMMNFTIFNVSNSFTPNADGINDTWKLDGMENYPNSDIQVFDRNGKAVLSKVTNGSFEWDGKFDSRALPTGNYWYIIKVSDGRILSGWLFIKNRN